MLTKIKEYFYKPQIGDVYYRDMQPSFLFDPWECDSIRKEDIIIEDIKEGYIKYSYGSRIRFTKVMQEGEFKSYYTKRK